MHHRQTSTPSAGRQVNNTTAVQGGVGNEPSSSANAPRSVLVHNNEHDQYREVITKHPTEFDPTTLEFWVVFDENIHTRLGPNKMKIKSIDPTTNFMVERTTNVIYKNQRKMLFQTTKHVKASDVWIDNAAAFSAYSVSFDWQPSNSELLSDTNYLDSYISEDSGLRKALQELIKMNPEITRIVMVMNEDKVIEYFEKECKLFNAHSYINFVSGFELTNKLYARFVQPKPLNVRKF